MKAFTSILHKVTGSQSPIRWNEHSMTLIGSGSSGPVYLAEDQSGSPIAVKQADIREIDEVKVLQKLSHKNIVKYLGSETKEDTSYILLEYVPGGSVSSHLKEPFNEDKMRMYAQQLLTGLQYLHQKEIKHGDVKGRNILIDADGCIKLADFGLSKQGAQLWMAPEVLLQKDLHNSRFTDKPDIWSVGCTVIEMATGEDPWRGKYIEGASFLKHMDKSDSVPPIPDNLSSLGKQFLRRCLQREPNSRASASQLLEDPFIAWQNFLRPSGAGQQHIVTPAAPKKPIVTPPAPKKPSVNPAAPKQRIVTPAAPKQRIVTPAAPKQRIVIPAAAPKQRFVIPAAAPRQRFVTPAAAPKQRILIPAAAPKQRFVTPATASKQRIVTPAAAPKQRFVTPSTQRVDHSATQATQPSVASSFGLHLVPV